MILCAKSVPYRAFLRFYLSLPWFCHKTTRGFEDVFISDSPRSDGGKYSVFEGSTSKIAQT
jgi:hypothetical protein